MRHTFTADWHGNRYYSNQVDGKYCLIICMVVGVKCANEFLMDNPDCSVLAEIGGIVLIGFTNDLGKESV